MAQGVESLTGLAVSWREQHMHSIAVSAAKAFDPVWLDAVTFEYTDPNSEARLTYTLQ